MAGPWYVRSTTGNNGNSGLTWALAKATIAGANAVAVSGGFIYVSQAHAETTAGSVTITFAGSATVPLFVICANDGAEPPTALATTATMTVTTSANIALNGTVYIYGITFVAGDDPAGGSVLMGIATTNWQRYEQCNFVIPNTSPNSVIQPSQATNVCPRIEWLDCAFKFAHTSQRIAPLGAVNIWWNNGKSGRTGILAGSSTPGQLFIPNAGIGVKVLVENVDFSSLATTFVMTGPPVDNSTFITRNCKLPTNWGNNVSSFTVHGREEMYNCFSGVTNFKFFIDDFTGQGRDEAVVVRTGGILDPASNLLSLKMTTGGNVNYPHCLFSSPEFAVLNQTPGVSKTVTVFLINNSATAFNNDEVYLEIQELGNASNPQGVRVSNEKANVITAAATQTLETTSAWDSLVSARLNNHAYVIGDRIKVASNPSRVFFCTVSGTSSGSEPVGYSSAIDGGVVADNTATFRAGIRQRLDVTFTPQLSGSFNMKVRCARQNCEFYVDPKPVIV